MAQSVGPSPVCVTEVLCICCAYCACYRVLCALCTLCTLSDMQEAPTLLPPSADLQTRTFKVNGTCSHFVHVLPPRAPAPHTNLDAVEGKVLSRHQRLSLLNVLGCKQAAGSSFDSASKHPIQLSQSH